MPAKGVLFVCMGNICRSPAAECVMRHLIGQNGLQSSITCDSAGTLAMHSGEAPDPRMQNALRRRSIPVSGVARQVKPVDLDKFDLILAMDQQNLSYLEGLARSPTTKAKIRLFGDFIPSQPGAEVPDPYYGGTEGFEKVLDMLQEGCAEIIRQTVSDK